MTLAAFLHVTDLFAYRPLATEDAIVGPMGELTVEGALAHRFIDPENSEYGSNFAFILGLGNAELSIEVGYINTPYGGSGFCDFLFFAKVNLIGKDIRSGLFTIKAEVLSTSGDEKRGPGIDYWETAGSGVVSKMAGPLSVHGQAGYNIVYDNESRTNSMLFGLALDYCFPAGLSLVAEVTGTVCRVEKPVSLLAGLIYEFTPDVLADLSLSRGITADADNWFSSFGATVIF